MQEQRKRAREQKAKQREEEGMQGAADEAQKDAEAQAKSRLPPVKAEPVTIVKGTFQEVLARRQAEIAALKRLNERDKAQRKRSRSPFQQ